MPYTYPSSRSAGYVVSAATWNSDVASNGQWLGQDRPAVCAVETTGQAIGSGGAGTALTFTAADLFDTQGQHSTSTNTSRITVTATTNAGLYYINASGLWPSNATGVRTAWIRLNGTTELFRVTQAAVSDLLGWSVSGIYRLTAATDYIEVLVYQNSGGSLTMASSTVSAKFSAVWIGA